MITLNKGRGEVGLEVDGRSYVLRPSFETLSAIEEATDKGTIELLKGMQDSTMKMRDIVVVLWIAAKRSKNSKVPPLEEFGEKIRTKLGLVQAGRVVLAFLGSAVSSDEQLREAIEQEKDDTKDPDPDPDPLEPQEKQESSPDQLA